MPDIKYFAGEKSTGRISRIQAIGLATCLALMSGCGLQIRSLMMLSIGPATPTKTYELLVANGPVNPRNPEIELRRVPSGSFVTLIAGADATCLGGVEQEGFLTQSADENHIFATLPISSNPFLIRAKILLPDHSLVCTEEVDLGFSLLNGITSVAVGFDYACAVSIAGTVYCWGDNTFGQLGDGTTTVRSSPTLVPGLSGVAAVTAGNVHTCAVLSAGTVYCWGFNANGRLGDGTTTSRPSPTLVPGLSGVAAVTAGSSHTCAVLTAGTVYCWGLNGNGRLGDGTVTDRPAPTLVPGLSGITAVAAGNSYTCAVSTAGTVYCWGANWSGRLGDGTITDRHAPTLVPGLSGIIAVTAGGSHTCAVSIAGSVSCWGYNVNGELGEGLRTLTRRWVSE